MAKNSRRKPHNLRINKMIDDDIQEPDLSPIVEVDNAENETELITIEELDDAIDSGAIFEQVLQRTKETVTFFRSLKPNDVFSFFDNDRFEDRKFKRINGDEFVDQTTNETYNGSSYRGAKVVRYG